VVRSLAEEKFKRINAAWEVLGDAERRRVYDERKAAGQAEKEDTRERLRHINTLWESGQIEDALILAARLWQSQSQDAQVRNVYANLLLEAALHRIQEGRRDEAAQLLTRAVDIAEDPGIEARIQSALRDLTAPADAEPPLQGDEHGQTEDDHTSERGLHQLYWRPAIAVAILLLIVFVARAWIRSMNASLQDPNNPVPTDVVEHGLILLAAIFAFGVLVKLTIRALVFLAATSAVAIVMLTLAGTIGVAPTNAGTRFRGPIPHPKGSGCGSSRTMRSGHLRWDRNWHSTECEVPAGGHLDFMVISNTMNSNVFPYCNPNPEGCDRGGYKGKLLCDDLPPMAIVGRVNGGNCFLIGQEERIHASQFGPGLVDITVNLPVTRPDGTPAKTEWIDLVGLNVYMIK
jgi:hypothetical protein